MSAPENSPPTPPAESGPPHPELDARTERLFELAGESWMHRLAQAHAAPSLGMFGAYELLGEIGRGGQGEVYRARQPGTGRIVALKRVAGLGLAPDPALIARFTREVEALTRLSHPNVVIVHALEVIDGHSVLVMECVEGPSIDRWADAAWAASPAALASVLGAFAAVCEGVAHAHQRGVIHLDIKPGNILVAPGDTPKVLDFGIARLIHDQADTGNVQPRSVTKFAGTPAYASPEQLRPGPAGVDTRSDVFSLGVLLFRMLTGREPLDAPGVAAAPPDDVPERAIGTPTRARAGLPRECDWIVAKATAAYPDRRYQSVAALCDDVRALLEGRVVAAAPPSRIYAAKKALSRHRYLALGVALVVGSLASATVLSVLAAERARTAERQTSLEVTKQRRVTELLSGLLGSSAAGTGGRPDITVREVLDRSVAEHFPIADQRNATLDPWVEATMRDAVGNTYLGIGRFDEAATHLRIAADLKLELSKSTDGGYLATMTLLGRALRFQGKLPEAETVLRRVVDARRGLGPEHRPALADTLSSLGICLRQLNRIEEAETCYREALALFEAEQGPDGESVARMSQNIAILISRAGKHEQAEEMIRRAVAILERRYPAGSPDVSTAVNTLGNVLWAAGKHEEGEGHLRRSIDMDRAMSKEPEVGQALKILTLAGRLAGVQRLDDAIALQRQALAIMERVTGPSSPQTLGARTQLARNLRLAQHLDEAEAVCRAATRTDLPAHVAADAGRLFAELAEVLLARGNVPEAEPALLKAWELHLSVASTTPAAKAELAARIHQFYHLHGAELGRESQAEKWRTLADEHQPIPAENAAHR